ncbi:NlpC/P60 family protein [Actinomycetes bacterium KLBMP 9797]
MALEPGREAVVRVAVATLWSRPDAVDTVDRPALGAVADISGWVSGMDAEQQVRECVLSQLLLGERVLVQELRPDGWARVVAVEQPAAKLDPRGYPGWLPAGQLTVPPPAAPVVLGNAAGCPAVVVVDAVSTALRAAPDGAVALPGVTLGTRLVPAGPPVRGWRPVWVPDQDRPLWANERDLAEPPATPPPATQVLAMARRLNDVRYVWGGVSGYGIDCSGLVHLAWRRFGVRLPRDADDLARATTPLAFGEERPGDLYFFARPGRAVHHIGFVSADPGADGPHMLHACYAKRRVLDEPLPSERVATLVAVHRVP